MFHVWRVDHAVILRLCVERWRDGRHSLPLWLIRIAVRWM